MSLGACPSAETLSAYMDRELDATQLSAVSAHLSECGACEDVLSGLRRVDAALLAAVIPERVKLNATPARRARRMSMARVLLIAAIVLLATAAGCAFGARLLGVFRTEHHVETRPAVEFPADIQKDIANGQEIEATPAGILPATQVEESLGTHLLEPSYLPQGYVLAQRDSPLRMFAEILYLKSADESISIRESNHQYAGAENPPVPPSAAESVSVKGHPAIYVEGGWYQAEPSATPVWRKDLGQSVLFDSDELAIQINASSGVGKEDLIRMAESMR